MSNVQSNVMPFIFAKLTEESQRQHEINGMIVIDKWVVMIAHCDFSTYNCKWMDDPVLGNVCMYPTVDICTDELHIFDNFYQARDFVKVWWSTN